MLWDHVLIWSPKSLWTHKRFFIYDGEAFLSIRFDHQNKISKKNLLRTEQQRNLSVNSYWNAPPLPTSLSLPGHACFAGNTHRVGGWWGSDGNPIPLHRVWEASSRAIQVAQTVKNPPAMQETLVQFLGWEDQLEKGKAILNSSILVWRIPWTV